MSKRYLVAILAALVLLGGCSVPTDASKDTPKHDQAKSLSPRAASKAFALDFIQDPETMPALRGIVDDGGVAGQAALHYQADKAATYSYKVADHYGTLLEVHARTEHNDSGLGVKVAHMAETCQQAYTDAGDGMSILDASLMARANHEIDTCTTLMGEITTDLRSYQ